MPKQQRRRPAESPLTRLKAKRVIERALDQEAVHAEQRLRGGDCPSVTAIMEVPLDEWMTMIRA